MLLYNQSLAKSCLRQCQLQGISEYVGKIAPVVAGCSPGIRQKEKHTEAKE